MAEWVYWASAHGWHRLGASIRLPPPHSATVGADVLADIWGNGCRIPAGHAYVYRIRNSGNTHLRPIEIAITDLRTGRVTCPVGCVAAYDWIGGSAIVDLAGEVRWIRGGWRRVLAPDLLDYWWSHPAPELRRLLAASRTRLAGVQAWCPVGNMGWVADAERDPGIGRGLRARGCPR